MEVPLEFFHKIAQIDITQALLRENKIVQL